ncbi:hypothetical protein BDV97DRAFT_390798 [Delphinella strobiligena]|nr:hypothetical protein BDV97DRAFT_390798 [Delphinella strobiligena]
MESTITPCSPFVANVQRHQVRYMIRSRQSTLHWHKAQATEKAPRLSMLQTLPTELVTIVVEFADWKDLPALRATSKVLCQIAFPPFCEAFFRRRRHVLSKHSLQALIDITAHPVFGPYVREIMIGSFRLSPKAMEGQQFAARVYHHLSNDQLVEAYGCMVHEQRLLEGSLRTRNDLLSDSSTVVHHQPSVTSKLVEEIPVGAQMLSTALDNIHSHGNTATIGVWNDVITAYRPDPVEDLWYLEVKPDPKVADMYHECESFGDVAFGTKEAYGRAINAAATSHCVTFTDEPFATTELLLQAKAASSCTVETFLLALSDEEMRQQWIFRISDQVLRSALASIKNFFVYRGYNKLDHDRYADRIGVVLGRDDKSVTLYKLLNKCTNVDMLGIFAPVNLRCLESGLLANLRTLRLANSHHGPSAFLRVLRRLPYSLMDLSLNVIHIFGRLPAQNNQPGKTGLIAALQYVSQSLRLHRLELYEVLGDELRPGGGLMALATTEVWVLEGKEVVREKLSETIMKLLAPEQIANP